jgi:hypothetical protein
MQEPEEGQTEVINLTQLMQVLTGEEVQGTPIAEITYPAVKQERKPGQELAKHRVRVSFDFDVTVDSGPVANESYDEGGTMDMALLKSFLVADKGKLLDMMVDCIGTKLGMHSCETFMHEFLPQVNIETHELFKPAIDALDGDEGEFWREGRDEPGDYYRDWMSLWTEEIVKCFSAEFVSSSYETIYTENLPSKDAPSIWDMVGLLKDDVQ